MIVSSKYCLPAENGQRGRWMISYTDVLTILLIFFVAIAAQSLPSLRPTPVRAAAQAGPAAAVQAGPAASQFYRPMRGPIPRFLNPGRPSCAPSLEKHGLDMRLEPGGLVHQFSASDSVHVRRGPYWAAGAADTCPHRRCSPRYTQRSQPHWPGGRRPDPQPAFQ